MSRRNHDEDKPSLILFVLGVLFLPFTLALLLCRALFNKRRDDWS